MQIDENLTSEKQVYILIEMEEKYLNYYQDMYDINPQPGKTRKGAKHSEATLELMTKIIDDTSLFLNRKHTPETRKILREKAVGSNNPICNKKKLISKLFSQSIFLYDANTFNLIAKYDRHQDLMDDLKISSKTVVKYKDTGEVFRYK